MCFHGNLKHFYGIFLPNFLWLVILICLVHSPYLVHLRILPCVWSRWILPQRPMGRTSLDMTPLWLPRSLFCAMCVWGGLLTLGMRNMWSVQGPASSLNCPAILVLEFWSMDNESPIAFPWGGAHLPPASGFHFGAWASHCGGFSGGREEALGCSDFSSFSSWAPELGFSSCGAWA